MNNAPTALVTGATGWLGNRLVQCLLNGLEGFPELFLQREVRCLIHKNDESNLLRPIPKEATTFEGSLTDVASLKQFVKGAKGGTLFHCAGIVHPTYGIKEFYQVNSEGTQSLIQAAIEAGVSRFIHVSSNSPIGCNPSPDELFDENSPYHPYMNYGKSKMLAEQIVNEAYQSGKIKTAIIRPPWFYGPGQPDRQTLFFKMIKEGKVPVVGDGENLRSMAYLDNICQGLLLCEKVDASNGETYWIADKKAYAMNEILNTIERVLEQDFQIPVVHKRIHLPNALGNFAEFCDLVLQNLSLYNQKIHVLGEMNKNIACKIDKAQKELGYHPRIDLEEGMRRSIQWIFDHKMSV